MKGEGTEKVFSKWAIWVAVSAGLVLSILSVLKVCASCSRFASFFIFGINFSWFGVGCFFAIAVLLALSRRYALADWLVSLFFFSAAGAEVWFIWVQKFVARQWCPICLGIAATVFLGCAVKLKQIIASSRTKGGTMKIFFKTGIALLAVAALGFAGAVLGVKEEPKTAGLDLFLGNKESATTVYFVSDWFCPGCRRSEGRIERMIPEIASRVRISFVDFPIHNETLNFTPYNLQFLSFEKEKYFELRKALFELAKKTDKPSPEDVQAAVAPLGVKLREVSYADILTGMKANMTVYEGWHIESTPSVVVVNTNTQKSKILVGEWKMRAKPVKAAIDEVEKGGGK